MINYKGFTAAELGIDYERIISENNLRFYDVRTTDAIRVYGLYDYKNTARYMRMPENVAKNVSESVKNLNFHTAGGRLRFVTTSEYIAFKMTHEHLCNIIFSNPIGVAGFDIYIKKDGKDTYFSSMSSLIGWDTKTPHEPENGTWNISYLPKGRKEITINMPIHQAINDLYIGLDSTAELSPREDYTYERPVLYYGSSITQGFCASRPGMAYESLISRRLDTNFINLGFSGSAKAEDAIIEYLASLDCSVFVLDYDHNAPTPEHLAATHEKLYLHFRETHPDTPVIMLSKPNIFAEPAEDNVNIKRREIIFKTYTNAYRRGEKVIFIDGASLFEGEMRSDCTVDLTHPNDLGMSRMADIIGKAVKHALSM